MRRDIRESAGLGSPPESINAALKQKTSFEESEWPDFVKQVQDLVNGQREEIIRALSGRGQYRLLPQYQHLAVNVQEWTSMRPDQRKQIIKAFDQANLSINAAEDVQQGYHQKT